MASIEAYAKHFALLSGVSWENSAITSTGVNSLDTSASLSITAEKDNFLREAKKNKIPTRKIEGFKGIAEGYYIIAGVFGNPNNAKKFVNTLRKKGLHPGILVHPTNGLNYISIDFQKNWKKSIAKSISKFDGKYHETTWILNVATPKTKRKAAIPIAKKEEKEEITAEILSEKVLAPAIFSDELKFKLIAKKHNVPHRIIEDLEGLESGYYMVAGVYGSFTNAQKFANKLRKHNLAPAVVTHPETGLNYVHLGLYKSGEKAISSFISKQDGRYKGKTWILNIKTPKIKQQGRTKESGKNKNKRPKVSKTETASRIYDANSGVAYRVGSKFSISSTSNDKLLQKADQYFAKMWYAEAAELYELFLSDNSSDQPFEIIRKAGDAHYFNTNMERAYYWYDILYTRHKDQMSADNIFKYAHSLKGTGKYRRAKRLMRLYNKKLAKGGRSVSLDAHVATSNERVLDNILSTEEGFELKNLAINSEYSDFAPMFHNENDLVFSSAMDSAFFTTRRYKWNNQPYLDLYVAKINAESQEVRNAMKFSKKINTKYHEASVTFSPDNKTMYFTRNNYGKKLKRDKNGINHLKIYMSKKVGGEWTEAVELPFNSNNYSTGHPAISPDGKQLYFVSDMPGSIGGTDIFVVDILGEGNFSAPRNLGPGINTERREMFPFISDKKLYFSSDGHVGIGGLDIYEAALDEENGFLEVKNLGKPVNSRVDDFSYIIDEETQKGFFASNRKGGKGDDDIYSFKKLIVEEASENAIAGVVTELVTGELMPEALVMLLDENNRKLKEVVTGDDGSFIFEDLDGTTKYTIKTVKGEFFDDEQVVTTKENEVVSTEVSMRRLKEMIAVEEGIKKLKTDMIYFDFDKSYIRKDASDELDKLVAVMTEYKTMVIKIESHTDSRGKRAYNKYLSDRRAKSTRDYLISKGIDPKRIESAIGYGEERLLNECDGSIRCSSSKHQLNRRSEFIIVSM